MKVKRVKVKLEPDAYLPERAHPTDAGLDLRTREKVVLWGGKSHVFDTGVHIEMPPGCYGKIESKSGLNVKQGIVSCGGVIDEGYTGSIVVKLYNFGHQDHLFKAGDKIGLADKHVLDSESIYRSVYIGEWVYALDGEGNVQSFRPAL